MFIGTTLYYFVPQKRYAAIARLGCIQPQDHRLVPPAAGKSDAPGYHSRKKIVLLTDQPRPDLRNVGLGSTRDSIIRLSVRYSPDFLPWNEFAKKMHLSANWLAGVEAGHDPQHWFVSTREITSAEILEAAISTDDPLADFMSEQQAKEN